MTLISLPSIRIEAPVIHFAAGTRDNLSLQ